MTAKLTAASAVFMALLSFPAFAQEAHTTRIEQQPYYGAVVTVEQGVRVFRPLPPHRHVIINPEGRTPIRLGVEETRVCDATGSHDQGRGGGY